MTRQSQSLGLRIIVVSALATLLFVACGGDDSSSSDKPTGSGGKTSSNSGGMGGEGGEGGEGGSDATGTGGKAGTGGKTGTGGAVEPMNEEGRPGMALVAGGVVASSEQFVGVFTLGEAPGGNRVMQSSEYRLEAGVVGAMQQ